MDRFFDRNIEKRCEYCTGGQLSKDGMNVLCKRKGIVEKGYHCLFFKYDPVMRIPHEEAPKLPDYDPEEFKI